jgi:hypothetical protein
MPASPTSPFLAERLVARLSPLRRANLERRVRERIEMLSVMNANMRNRARYYRTQRLLGRLAAWI